MRKSMLFSNRWDSNLARRIRIYTWERTRKTKCASKWSMWAIKLSPVTLLHYVPRKLYRKLLGSFGHKDTNPSKISLAPKYIKRTALPANTLSIVRCWAVYYKSRSIFGRTSASEPRCCVGRCRIRQIVTGRWPNVCWGTRLVEQKASNASSMQTELQRRRPKVEFTSNQWVRWWWGKLGHAKAKLRSFVVHRGRVCDRLPGIPMGGEASPESCKR